MGVNENEYTSDMTYVSCASCTTNGLPHGQVHSRRYGIEFALMTTVHAMTSTQMVVMAPQRRTGASRGASSNIILHPPVPPRP